jgi:hypothetical protein
MALSNTFSFSVVRDDIIRMAMLNVGALGEGEVATAQEVTDCALKLNMMVKQWMGTQDFAPGLKMWTRQRGTLFLSTTKNKYILGGSNSDNWAGGLATGTGTYATNQVSTQAGGGSLSLTFANQTSITTGDYLVMQVSSGDIFSTTATTVSSTIVGLAAAIPNNVNVNSNAYVWNYSVRAQRPLQLDFRTATIVLRDINNNDTPLNFMTLQEYEALPNKAMPTFVSDPTACYYESQFGSGLYQPVITGGGALYLDAFPQDITKKLHAVYMRPVMDMNNPSDNPEYPQQWYRALTWGLSKEIAPMFDAEWTRDMEETFGASLSMAREQDSETSNMYFLPGRDESF